MSALPGLELPSSKVMQFLDEDERWIYFLQGDDGGPIKIGSTKRDPRWRCEAVQLGYPFGILRIVGLIRDSRKREGELHRRFRSQRLLGEWFTADGELLVFLRSLVLPRFGARP